MKRLGLTALCLFFGFQTTVFADDEKESLLNSEFDAIFDAVNEPEAEPEETEETGEKKSRSSYNLLQELINRTGFAIDTSYEVMGGFLPGWDEAPWYFGEDADWRSSLSNLIGAKMKATLGLDIQPSQYLLIRQSFTFSIPSPPLTIKEFYFDYNYLDHFYVKAGKFESAWGVSPNFPFANLLARTPAGIENPGDTYIAQLDIPIGIGGFNAILLTRPGYIDFAKPRLEDFGGGLKYNIAKQNWDIDLGFFYFELMPLRSFISLKTTLFRQVEFYSEAMININHENWSDWGFSGTAGIMQFFFHEKLRLNLELYYNGEGNSSSLRRNSLLDDDEKEFRLFDGFNSAVNISYKPGGLANLHIFFGYLHALLINSAQIVPGIVLEPAKHVQLYFAVPMAAGTNDPDSYYRHNADTNNRPFSLVLAVKIKGAYNFGHFDE